jgi:hypothetical protein
MIRSKYGRLKARFTHEGIAEFGCTADPSSVEKEQTFEKVKA